jgi:hypothetical protein
LIKILHPLGYFIKCFYFFIPGRGEDKFEGGRVKEEGKTEKQRLSFRTRAGRRVRNLVDPRQGRDPSSLSGIRDDIRGKFRSQPVGGFGMTAKT